MKKFLILVFSSFLTVILMSCDSRNLSDEEREEKIGLVIEAREYLEAEQYNEAEATYKKALDENPLIARPHLDLAMIYQQHIINHIHAIYHYDRYLELRPETEKKEFIIEQRLKVARMLASAFLNASPEVKRLLDQNQKLVAEVKRLRGNTVTDNPEKETIAKTDGYTIYHVKKGDTLSRIAKQFYDDPAQWELVYNANRDSLKSPSGIRVGQTLIIPEAKVKKSKRTFR